MNRGQFLLRLSFVVTLLAGVLAVYLLKSFSTLSPVELFGVSTLIGIGVFVMLVAVLSKMGY